MHGGIGVTWEHDIHLYLRRATVNRVMYGTPASTAGGSPTSSGCERTDESIEDVGVLPAASQGLAGRRTCRG